MYGKLAPALLFLFFFTGNARSGVFFLGSSVGEGEFAHDMENVTGDNIYSQEDADNNCDGRYQYYCKSPQVCPAGKGCGGRCIKCACPDTFDITSCSDPDYEPEGETCGGNFASSSCKCKYTAAVPAETTQACAKRACNNTVCIEYGCDESKYGKTCEGEYQPGSLSCGGKYEACVCSLNSQHQDCKDNKKCFRYGCDNQVCLECRCPNNYNKTCTGTGEEGADAGCVGEDGLRRYAACKCKAGHNTVCVSPKEGVGAACTADGGQKYQNCRCLNNYNKTCTGTGEEGADAGCVEEDGLRRYAACKCKANYRVCSYPYTGDGTTACTADGGQKYQNCRCTLTVDPARCVGDYAPTGASCDGKYERCECRYNNVRCGGNDVCKEHACGGSVCTRCGPCEDTCENHGLKSSGGSGCTYKQDVCGNSCYQCSSESNCQSLGYTVNLCAVGNNPQTTGCGGHYGFYYVLPEWVCPADSCYIKRCAVCGVGQGGHPKNTDTSRPKMRDDNCASTHGHIDAGKGRNDIIWLHNRCDWATN